MFHLFALALCFGMYFLPSIVGHNKRNFGAIFVLNFLLGWTIVGWIVALVWALTADAPVWAPRAHPSCSVCRTPIRASQSFCSGCGSPLAWPQGTAAGPNAAH
jgi:Superinfection immunity protein